jgi:hypothetical protein
MQALRTTRWLHFGWITGNPKACCLSLDARMGLIPLNFGASVCQDGLVHETITS